MRCGGGGGDKLHVLADTLGTNGKAAGSATLQDAESGLLIAFDTTQITSAANRSNPKAGDPCHPLTAGAHPPAIAFGGNNTAGPIDCATALAALAAHGGPHGRLDFASETFVVHGTQDPDVAIDRAHSLGRNSGQENAVCITGDITHTLKADGFDASEDGTGRGQPIIAQQQQGGVRRLTPRECERLQGFPDNWTLIPYRGKEAADGPRYKALGNSMAVPVMAWIGQRIQMVENLCAENEQQRTG